MKSIKALKYLKVLRKKDSKHLQEDEKKKALNIKDLILPCFFEQNESLKDVLKR